jgi:hypothetical protein
MANQALIQAAQRMYGAKYAQAKKDITPIIQSTGNALVNINNAVKEKRARQEKESKEKVEVGFIDLIKQNPELRPKLAKELEAAQDEYNEELKKAERTFGRSKNKEDARNNLAKIENELLELENVLKSVNLKQNMVSRGDVSDYNSMEKQVDDTVFSDSETLMKNIVIENRKAYFINSKGKREELKAYEPPVKKHRKAILGLSEVNQTVGNKALEKGFSFTPQDENSARTMIQDYLNEPERGSLFFDKVGDFKWIDAQLFDKKEAKSAFVKDENGKEVLDDGLKFKDGNPGITMDENGVVTITDEAIYLENLETMRKRVAQRKAKFSDGTVLDYDKEFENDYVEALRATSQENLVNYERIQQEKIAEFNRRNPREPRPFNTAVGHLSEDEVRGLFDDIKNGYVKDYKFTYKKFGDKFYKVDTNENKLKEDSKGITERQMLSILRISGHASKFGFKSSDSSLSDYRFKDDDSDRVPNFLDDTSNKFSPLTLGDTPTKQDNTLLNE